MDLPALVRGGTPHLLFQCPDEFQVGQLVTVEMGSTEKAGQTLTDRITFVTSTGTATLPADLGIVSIALERSAEAPDSSNSAGRGQKEQECLQVNLSVQESKAFWDLLFTPDLTQERRPRKKEKRALDTRRAHNWFRRPCLIWCLRSGSSGAGSLRHVQGSAHLLPSSRPGAAALLTGHHVKDIGIRFLVMGDHLRFRKTHEENHQLELVRNDGRLLSLQ